MWSFGFFKDHMSIFRAFNVWSLCHDNMDRRITHFLDNSQNNVSLPSYLRNYFNTIPGSKLVICFGIIGFKLRIPLCIVLLYLVFQILVRFVLFNNDNKVDQAVTRDE